MCPRPTASRRWPSAGGQSGTWLLPRAANAEYLLPRHHVNAEGNMIHQAFWTYALPLIDGPLSPLARLQGQCVGRKVAPGPVRDGAQPAK